MFNALAPLRLATIVTVAACQAPLLVPSLAGQEPSIPSPVPGSLVFVHPARRPSASTAPLPPLPTAAHEVTPLTLQVMVQRSTAGGRTATVRQTVSRTRERVHIDAGQREWLFVRNPVDPRRVSGVLVDHATRTLIEHEESDLRHMVGVAGWIDVLSLGLDPAVLPGLVKGETRSVEGFRFRRYTAPAREDGVSEAWWCEEQLLAREFVVRERSGSTRLFVERMRRGVDVARLDAPSLRLPDYRIVGLAEWLEEP